ncbi:type 1 glutamine amidotransferase [Acholeplasma laidlawii]|uniref:type 1 glutamine amidotransferase domain-containing protein n=1 Tax=Acholeplasma laidlawii TaxID=2148 RepID=UPI0018C2744B|nr:type 1 glutamine amidotransferase domain-containing protein [Acholeplasma laidlawii]MBG0762164.1 type 1 glutamine amidotransferase [Acholeplasma laidlawii]WIF87855.1 type 1 glutamine amidotransferase domain-containing protein [Acholeplasma laidlawii]
MLNSKRILTIVSNDYDDLEFHYPLIRLKEAGATVDIASEIKGHTYKGKYGLSTVSDLSFDEVDITKYDGIIIPGGWAPDYLRRLPKVLEFVRYLNEHKKIIGSICHAGWVLSSAGILKGVTLTSTPGIKDDMMYAGATWVDKPVVVDQHIVTARRPIDLPYYLPKLIESLSKQ